MEAGLRASAPVGAGAWVGVGAKDGGKAGVNASAGTAHGGERGAAAGSASQGEWAQGDSGFRLSVGVRLVVRVRMAPVLEGLAAASDWRIRITREG
jgi:hypothetical protein